MAIDPLAAQAAPIRTAPRGAERDFSNGNQLGVWTLYRREVRRFAKVAAQTLFAPLVSTLLFMMVFSLAFGEGRSALGVRFADFLGPGLVMMAILTNAFANSSSSLIIAKIQGNAVDFLMPPLSPGELTLAFVAGAATRGLVVGALSLIAIAPLCNVVPAQPLAAIFYAVFASVMMAAAGLLAGVWADKFDNLAAIQNFAITPLTFLSGTFYEIDVLPEPFRSIGHYNPFFFLIDGFRFGFIGKSDNDLPPLLAAGVTLALTLGLVMACHRVLKTGYKLKA